MASRKNTDATQQGEDVDQLARIANLIALLLIKGENQADKVMTLSAAGYTPGEIASMLGTTPNAVSVAVYQAKKKGKKSKPKGK